MKKFLYRLVRNFLIDVFRHEINEYIAKIKVLRREVDHLNHIIEKTGIYGTDSNGLRTWFDAVLANKKYSEIDNTIAVIIRELNKLKKAKKNK